MGLRAEEVVVPHAEEGQHYRQVRRQRGGKEVIVHRMRAAQQLLEAMKTHRHADGQADTRVQRVASAYPVPEREHVGRVDAKGGHSRGVGGECHKMARDVRWVGGGGEEPGFGGVRICQCFLCREGLGGDDEERGGWRKGL